MHGGEVLPASDLVHSWSAQFLVLPRHAMLLLVRVPTEGLVVITVLANSLTAGSSADVAKVVVRQI